MMQFSRPTEMTIQRMIKTGQKIITHLTQSLKELYCTYCLRNTYYTVFKKKYKKVHTQGTGLFEVMPSGRCYRQMRTKIIME